jgi:hypothetical protein
MEKVGISSTELDFETHGLQIIPNFLSPETLQTINAELDGLFARPSINGSLYSIFLGQNYQEVMIPSINVRSVNLLEIALGMRDAMKKVSSRVRDGQYRLTDIEIFSERKNPQPLFWHTDNRPGMLRAQIYLRGGQSRSGAFQYMLGTHRRDYFVKHKLSAQQISDLQDKVFDCIAPEGSLVLFDPVGFHAKRPNIEERRSLFFEIQPRGVDYAKGNAFLYSANLSATVRNNLDFFVNDVAENQEFTMGVEGYFRQPKALPVNHAAKALVHSIRHRLLRDIRDTYQRLAYR